MKVEVKGLTAWRAQESQRFAPRVAVAFPLREVVQRREVRKIDARKRSQTRTFRPGVGLLTQVTPDECVRGDKRQQAAVGERIDGTLRVASRFGFRVPDDEERIRVFAHDKEAVGDAVHGGRHLQNLRAPRVLRGKELLLLQLQSLESLSLGEEGESLRFNEGIVRGLRSRGGLLVEQIVQNAREGFERVVLDFDALRELAAFQRLQFEHVAADEDLNVAERLIERRRRDADRLPAARQQKVVEGELLRESNALHLRFFEVPRAVFAQRLQKRFDAIAKVLEALHERFFHDLNTTCLAAGRKVPLDERDVELRRHERLLVHQIVVGERKVACKARCGRFRESTPNEAPDAVNLNGRVVGGNHAQ